MNQDEKRSYREQLRIGTLVGCGGGITVVGFIFAPLLLALVEYVFFGTQYVEDLFETMGIHDMLGDFYRPILDVIEPYIP